MQGRKIYQEKLFTNFQLSNRVPKDNFYRLLTNELDLAFIYPLTKKYYGRCGQKGIDPIVFFKFMLIGYIENINSDRHLVSHCSMRLDLLYFLGYDIDEELPWHSTISRTRKRLPASVFESLFEKTFLMCVDKGLVSGHTQSIDSAFVKANASMESLVLRQPLMSISSYLNDVKKQDEASGDNNINNQEENKPKPSKNIKRSNQTHFSPSDTEAKIAYKKGKKTDLYYYCQMGVDASHNIISYIEAQKADNRDSNYLLPAVIKSKTLIEKSGLVMQNVLADTNYSSAENYYHLENMRINAYIPAHGQYKGMPDDFKYNKEQDCWICSCNQKLLMKRSYVKENRKIKSYRISQAICGKCSNKACYLKQKKVKSIELTYYNEYVENAIKRINSKRGKYLSKVRKTTVEPTFGTLMDFMGMRKVYTKGVKTTNKVFIMTAIAYNLKKYMKYITKKANVNKAVFVCYIKNSLKRIRIEISNHSILCLRIY